MDAGEEEESGKEKNGGESGYTHPGGEEGATDQVVPLSLTISLGESVPFSFPTHPLEMT